MKFNEEQNTDDNIKRLLKASQNTVDYNFDLESSIMKSIEVEIDHSVSIAADKRKAKIGRWISAGLFSLLILFVFKESIQDISFSKEPGFSKNFLIVTLFSLIGMITMYIQVEWNRSARESIYFP